jgi:L-cysteine:1D-myo-inositol 2-amino-2-deoxy-alpha-D-glucopyranoside ligase
VYSWPEIYLPPLDRTFPPLQLFDTFRDGMKATADDRHFTMYICGITPYDATHLGHAATYLSFDLIHRYQRASGKKVSFLENVTDIDDPLFERAKRDGVDWQGLGLNQIELFQSDMTQLRILPPYELSLVTEKIQEIIALIEMLIAKNATYKLDGDIYLDAALYTDFGNLPFSREESLKVFAERGGDPDRLGKRNPLDPLLWRNSSPGEPSWATSFGEGRPGWHIECNAIARALVDDGATRAISLQGGGKDLAFPHHYMTALQGAAISGEDFAKHYVHAGMIYYQGEKMSKSLGNLIFVSQLIKDGINPVAIRLALILSHYRQDRSWSLEILDEAQDLISQLGSALSREVVPDYSALIDEIILALSQDLDTPKVFSLIRSWLKSVDNKDARVNPGALSRILDALLGLTF